MTLYVSNFNSIYGVKLIKHIFINCNFIYMNYHMILFIS